MTVPFFIPKVNVLTFSVCTKFARTLHNDCTKFARTNHIHSDSYGVSLHEVCTNFARCLHDNCTPRKNCTMFARLRRCKIRELRGRFARCLHDAGKFQTLYVVKYNILYINIIIYTIITRARARKSGAGALLQRGHRVSFQTYPIFICSERKNRKNDYFIP